jgi:RNA polymerase sigma factor (sigma-70 family)
MAVAESSSTPNTMGGRAQFPPTLWSVVLAAGARDRSAHSQEALAALCRAYWDPIYAFLRRQGKTPHDAEDFTQAFFLHLLQRDALARVDRDKGRFRSFLLASLKNFLVDEWEKTRTQKRGGGAPLLSIDVEMAESRYQVEAGIGLDPEKLFERRWAITLLNRVLAKLEGEATAASQAQRFEQLKVFLPGEPGGAKYAEVAAALGLSEGAVKVAVLRLRHRFRDLLRAEIAQTVADEAEVEQELRYLVQLLALR